MVVVVVPERNTRSNPLRKDQIHPAVVVEIKNRNAISDSQTRLPGNLYAKSSLARVLKYRGAAFKVASEDKVNGSVIVVIAP